jgi:hypothetical protein
MVKERKILDRKPKEIPGMDGEKDEVIKDEVKKEFEIKIEWPTKDEIEEIEGQLGEETKREKRKPPAGETDYGWCDEEELPTIETTFDEDEEITNEKTNRKVIR